MILSVKCFDRGSFSSCVKDFAIVVNFRDIGNNLKPFDYSKVFYFNDSIDFSNAILHYIHLFFPHSCNHKFQSDFVLDFDLLSTYFYKLNCLIGSKIFLVD